MRVFSLILVVNFWLSLETLAQCNATSIIMPPSVCIQQEFEISYSAQTVGDNVTWDLCAGDLVSSSSGSEVVTLTNISAPRGITTLTSEQGFFSFVVGENNRLIRTHYPNGLESTPAVTNFQNIGNLLSTPRGVTHFEENGRYYLVIVNLSGSLILVDFGNDLLSTPVATSLSGLPSLVSATNLVFYEINGNKLLYVLGVGTGNRQVTVLNYGSSIFNAPSSTIWNFPTASGLSSLSLLRECNNWFGLLMSNVNNRYYKLILGTDPSTLDSQEELVGIAAPLGSSLRWESGEYFGFVSTNGGDLIRLNFGSDFTSPGVAGLVNLGNYGLLSETRAFEMITNGTLEYALAVGYSTKKVVLIKFANNCGVMDPVLAGLSSVVTRFESSGSYTIAALIDNSDALTRLASSLIVSPSIAPDISFTSQNICANHDVNFSSQNTSGDITDYSWDFGDTNSSIDPSPTHQYALAGDYEVSLQVTASNGCNNLARESISIFNQPTANFDLPLVSPICTNQQYLFINSSTFDPGSNPSWQWEVNSAPAGNSQDLNHSISSAVQQDIRLIASIPGCFDEVIKSIVTVEEGPLADFTFTNDCVGNVVDFTNMTSGAVDGYTWDFGDSNTSNQTNGVNTYSTLGEYDVTLTATNVAGCNNSATKPITIYSKPQPDFSLELPPFSCAGSISQFNDLTASPTDSNLESWSWSFGDLQNGASAERNAEYIFDLAGDYNVNLTVSTNFGCSETVQKTITIAQSPSAEFSFSAACINQATVFTPTTTTGVSSWQWKIGSATYNQQSPIHVFNVSSTVDAQLTTTGSNNCISILSKPVMVPVAPIVNFEFGNACTENPTTFDDISIAGPDALQSWSWNFAGIGAATGSTASFAFSDPGTYPVVLTVTTSSGCNYAISRSVNVSSSPVASFTASPVSGTPPLAVSLTNTSLDIVSQAWSVVGGQSSSEPNPQFTFNELGEYVVDLTVVNAAGCTDSNSKLISVIVPSLDIELTKVTLVPVGNEIYDVLVEVLNKSNTQVSDLVVAVDISGVAQITELFGATIPPQSGASKLLSSGVVLDNTRTNYICVELELDGDVNLGNNRGCVSPTSLIVLNPFPNPAVDEVSIDWVAATPGTATIHIFNSAGQLAFEHVETSYPVGLNHLVVPTATMNPGIYYVNFAAENIVRNFTIMIQR